MFARVERRRPPKCTVLLTLLNVSATKAGKRKRIDEFVPAAKLNRKRKSITFATEPESIIVEEKDDHLIAGDVVEAKDIDVDAGVEDAETEDAIDTYEQHYGVQPSVLSEASRTAVDRRSWKLLNAQSGHLGMTALSIPDGSELEDATDSTAQVDILERLKLPFQSRQSKLSRDHAQLQNDLLSTLSSRRDLYITSIPIDSRKYARDVISLHALNHVTKKRRRVLKNNERLAHAAKTNPEAEPPADVLDQGFTRPSVLFLLPFRSSAIDWFIALTSHTPTPSFQIENQSRFMMEYGLPSGAIDKLATAEPGTYPPDHVETFKGNVDDNFRVGIKMTRKSMKMFAEFYKCDIIIASPLGLRQSIEREKNADYLSSVEILVIDQMDALTMQNWDHVKFVLSHVNQLPKESHDTDFSRIKPWYLDGHAGYLRQSILLSTYETPETRALYSSLRNVAGKIRTQKRWSPIDVPEGIDQNFIRFDCVSPKDEAEKRFHHFTTQVLPIVLKSAVQSANAAVFVPSSFDFIRVHNYFKKHAGVTFTVLSEYSSNQDISRARQAFFQGKKSFLLVSERFHFYRRYKIRGIRNLIFYGPPDHPQFFTELLSYPFLDEGVEASDVTCRVLYSKFDWFRLERIAGTDSTVDLMKST